jgi:hypothetical protein
VNAVEQKLMHGRVLVEVGWLAEAELEVGAALADDPSNLDALGLLAKIKHISGELSLAFACWTALHTRARAALARVWADRWSSEDERAAILAIANRAERTGHLEPARDELERLGRVQACALDPGRLLTLIEIYARLATPEASEAGARICRHLLRDLAGAGVDKLSLLGALAMFERRCGRDRIAEALEARFASAFRRRMHRPSLLDLVRVAARRYLPLAQLRAIAPRDPHPRLGLREQALALALSDRPRAARELFERGDGVLDRVYAAELDGDDQRAIGELLAALRAGARDPQLVGWLLDRHATRPSRAIAEHFCDRQHHDRARTLLEHACARTPHRPEPWRRLALLHELAGRDASRYATRATAATAALAPPIGRTLAAGVTRLEGSPKGLLHELWVQRTPTTPGRGGGLAAGDILGNLTSELRSEIRNTFVAVRAYARSKLPHLTTDLDDFTYLYKIPKDDAPSGGASAGLPSALAMLSVILQRPIATSIASSGAVICEAHDTIAIARIGDAEYKVKAACHANARMLILPMANRPDLESSRLVPPSVTHSIVRYVRDLDAAARLVFGDDLFTRP